MVELDTLTLSKELNRKALDALKSIASDFDRGLATQEVSLDRLQVWFTVCSGIVDPKLSEIHNMLNEKINE